MIYKDLEMDLKNILTRESESFTYKRKDGFRLVFQEPISANFKILELQGKKIESNEGFIQILDMSLTGAKVMTTLQIPANNTRIQLECIIHEQQIGLVGELKWIKDNYKGFVYGLTFDPQSYSEQLLLTELKNYVKKHK